MDFWWSLNLITGVLVRESREDSDTEKQRREDRVRMEAGIAGMHLQAQVCQGLLQVPEAG